MTITPLHHVVLSVTDFDRSLTFYRDALGFRKTMESPVVGYEKYLHIPEGSKGRMAMLAVDDGLLGMIEIIEWDIPGGAQTGPAKRAGDPGVQMLAMEVHDDTLEAIAERWQEMGIELHSPITPVELEGYPRFQTLIVEDPDGLLVELIQLPTQDEVKAFRAALREKQAS